MSSYYNEFDPQKAAWLRELIREGAIAPGDVDERSIADLRPDDLRGYAQCHFFAGIGIWSYALRLADWPDDREVWTGSCPCQPFSAAGKGEAFNDERHLWPELFRLIEARRPVVCFGEQVSSIDGLAWFDIVHPDLEHADYTVGVLDSCAAGLGAPHRRQRLYWVADAGIKRGQREDAPVARGNQSGNGIFSRNGVAGGLADSSSERRQQDAGSASGDETADGRTRRQRSESADHHIVAGYGTNGRLEDTLRAERRPDLGPCNGYREAPGRDESANRAGERGEVERVGNAAVRGFASEFDAQGAGGWRATKSSVRGPVNGFWRDADWVLTRPQRVGDRPGLRPVERGAFPLAHGATARVGRLRGYGDGIVAPQAAAFVRAYMEVRG